MRSGIMRELYSEVVSIPPYQNANANFYNIKSKSKLKFVKNTSHCMIIKRLHGADFMNLICFIFEHLNTLLKIKAGLKNNSSCKFIIWPTWAFVYL